jgi:heme exporter protein A
MLDANDLECLRGTRRLFAGISFALAPGECLQVHGANGSGKTSLLRIVCGLSRPERGTVRWNGEPIDDAADVYRGELAFCGHANALKEDLTPAENLVASAALYGTPATDDSARAALDAFGILSLEALPVRALSQGQKRRVALARLAICPRRLWILDEPLAALDARAAETLAARLDSHLAQGGLAVLTSHQPIELRAPMRSLALS